MTTPRRLLAATAVAALMAVAALCRARPPTTRDADYVRDAQCFDHLRRIGVAMRTYLNENAGRYPADLAVLAAAHPLDLPTFACPASVATRIPADWRRMSPAEQGDWIRRHADYVYRPGQRMDFGPATPVVYDRGDNRPGGAMDVLFADGHVERLSPVDARRRVGPGAGAERTTTRLSADVGGTVSLPPFTVDEAKAAYAAADLDAIRTAVQAFQADHPLRYPTTAQGLDVLVHRPVAGDGNWHKHLAVVPTDPWGHAYRYVCNGDGSSQFHVTSAGPDGQFGTPDDVN